MSLPYRGRRLSGPIRAAAAVCLLVGTSAQALTVAFSGSGLVTGPAQVPPAFVMLTVAPATSHYTLNGMTGWSLDAVFSFNAATLTGSGSGAFEHGADALDFTFTSTAAALGDPLSLSYTITGGSGAFASYTGSGSSTVALLGNPLGLPEPIPFMETAGTLTLAVPEPPPAALIGLGLGFAAWRTRRATAIAARQQV